MLNKLNLSKVADHLKVSRGTIHKWQKEEKWPLWALKKIGFLSSGGSIADLFNALDEKQKSEFMNQLGENFMGVTNEILGFSDSNYLTKKGCAILALFANAHSLREANRATIKTEFIEATRDYVSGEFAHDSFPHASLDEKSAEMLDSGHWIGWEDVYSSYTKKEVKAELMRLHKEGFLLREGQLYCLNSKDLSQLIEIEKDFF